MILAPTRSRAALLPAVFTATIFLSASLLFFVQPLFAKIVLPRIGGAPAVWTTAMLFFQTVLIGGYLYAHLLTRWLPTGAQVAVHLSAWALALLFLPLGVSAGWSYDPSASPALQTLTLFALGVGLPFAVLSANAPLIQSWYARSGAGGDPYRLYSASNVGSLLALLAFPLMAEPLLGATRISQGWAAGFVLLGGLLLLSGLAAATGRAAPALRRIDPAATAPLRAGRVGAWLLLAFVPSSLMLAVTTKMSIDLGAVPLFWVLPLALYLLTFVVAFAGRPWIGARGRSAGFAFGLAVLAAAFAGLLPVKGAGGIALLLASFFLVALWSHGRLHDARPPESQLTLFYVVMSVGGALGGLFNSILAPVVFDAFHEGAATVAVAALLPLLTGSRGGAAPLPQRLGSLALALAMLATIALIGGGPAERLRDRSFFGTHRVYDAGEFRFYMNGTTLHGAERLADLDAPRPTPLTYYGPNGPMGQVMASARGQAAHRVGIVGLGVGSLACYRRPGQDWHFYEIDPLVDAIARDPALFTFMSACAGDAPTHLGDARLVLDAQEGLLFDLLVIDAYSSDAVPMHLTTTEAMDLYLRRLAPGGVLLFHVSNRYFDLRGPLGRGAALLGLTGLRQVHRPEGALDLADTPSEVVLLARDAADFGDLARDPRWTPLALDEGPLWTDDRANLLSALRPSDGADTP